MHIQNNEYYCKLCREYSIKLPIRHLVNEHNSNMKITPQGRSFFQDTLFIKTLKTRTGNQSEKILDHNLVA